MSINPTTLSRPWDSYFLPKADRTHYAGSKSTTWETVSGAAVAGRTVWVDVAASGDLLLQVAAAAPTGTANSFMVRGGGSKGFALPPGEQLFARSRTGTVVMAARAWILEE